MRRFTNIRPIPGATRQQTGAPRSVSRVTRLLPAAPRPLLVTTILLALTFGYVFADTGGQIVGFAAAALVENPSSVEDLPQEYQNTDDEDLFGGIEGEIWFDRFGFGLRHAGRFDLLRVEVLDEDDDPVTTSTKEAWWYDAQTDLFAAFHLFGGGSFIDPYLRYGVGFAARYSLNENFGFDREREVWTTAEAPRDSDDDNDSDHSYDRVESAGMYQYIGGGIQCNLSGLVLGVGVNYNVLHQRYGSSDYEWEIYPASRFEARVYGGVAF